MNATHSLDEIFCISQPSSKPSSPKRKTRRRRFRMGISMIRATASRIDDSSAVFITFCFITMLATTLFICDDTSNKYHFGQVFAWQSGTSILTSSSCHRRHSTIPGRHPQPPCSSTCSKALHTNWRLKRFLSSSSSSPSSSSLWISPSLSSSSSMDTSESLHDSSLEEMSDNYPDNLLQSFLPSEFRNEDTWKSLPLTRALLENLAKNHVMQQTRQVDDDDAIITLDLILNVVDKEYDKSSIHTTRSNGNNNNNDADAVVIIDGISFDVSASGDPADERVAQILSLAAMYHVPKELTLQLLDCTSAITAGSSSSNGSRNVNSITWNPVMASAKAAFANGGGWNSITFPKGFALQTKNKDDHHHDLTVPRRRRGRWSGIWNCFVSSQNVQQEIRRKEAAVAVEAAAAENTQISAIRRAARRKMKSRDEFLSHLNAELSESTPATITMTTTVTFPNNNDDSTEHHKQKIQDQLVFFPDSVPGHHLSLWKRLRRGLDKSYDLLKKKGRAGFLAYAFFNFAFYSIGFLWQWRRAAPADPFALSSSSATAALSVLSICCRKFGRVFAYLYVISNLIKLPKIFISALLVPSTESALATVKKRLRISEAAACMFLVALLAVLWIGIVSIPISAEIIQLKRLVHLDHVIQGYIIQPV